MLTHLFCCTLQASGEKGGDELKFEMRFEMATNADADEEAEAEAYAASFFHADDLSSQSSPVKKQVNL